MKGFRNIFALSVSLICLGLVLYFAGTDILQRISVLDYIDVLLVTLLLFVCFLFALLRFKYLLGIFDHRPKFTEVFLSFSIGQISNQYLLNIVGQSLSRAVVLSRFGVPFGTTVMLTYVERALSAGILFAVALCSAWIVFLHIGLDLREGGEYLIYIMIALALVSFVNGTLIYKSSAINSILPRNFINLKKIWPAVILTLVIHLFMLFTYLLILTRMVDLEISAQIIAAVFIVMFAASLPISFSGWGVRELSAAATLSMVGVEPAVAIAAAILVGLVSQLLTFLFIPVSIFLSTNFNADSSISRFTDLHKNISIDSWQKIILKACILFCATFIFFQIWLPVGENQINVNFADAIALTGLGIVLFDLYIRRSFTPFPRILVITLACISLILVFGLILGYSRFGPENWAIYNRGLGWIVILSYVAMGSSILLVDGSKGQTMVLKALIYSLMTIVILQLFFTVSFFAGYRPFSKYIFNLPLAGFANNANTFSFQMVMVLIAIVVAYRLGLFGRKLWYFYLALALLGLANYFTYSRAGGIIYFLVLILMIFTAKAASRKYEIYAALIATGSFFAGKMIPALLDYSGMAAQIKRIDKINTKQIQANYSADAERWVTVKDGLNLWWDQPLFGSGLGSYIHKQLEYGDSYIVIHSIPVWLLAETGLVGFMVILMLFLMLLKYSFELLKKKEYSAWGFGLIAVLLCIGVAGLVHDFFYQRIFWFLLGLFIAVRPVKQG